MAGEPRRRSRGTVGSMAGLGVVAAERRLALRLTQADVADLAGVGVATVRALEAGKGTVSLDGATRVLEALGLGLGVADLPALRSATGVHVVARNDP